MSITVEEFGRSVDIGELFVNLNLVSDGWFTGLLLLFVWLMLIGMMQIGGFTFGMAFYSASFILLVLGALLFALDVLSITFLILTIILFVGGILIAYFEK